MIIKQLVIILYISSISIKSYSQIIPSLENLNNELIEIHTQNLDAEITEFKTPNKYNWVYFIPSIGYDVLNNTPSLKFSVSGVSRLLNQQKRKNQKIISIQKKADLTIITSLYSLKTKYNNLNNEIKKISFKISLFNDYKNLYFIKKNQYKNKEITTENWIEEKIKIKEKAELIRNYYSRINKRKEELQLIIKRELMVQLPKFNFKIIEK